MERDRRPLLDRPMPRCFRIQHANSWSVLAVPCMVCWFPVPLRLCTEVETAVLTRFFCYTKIVGGGVKSHEAVMQLEFNATIVLTVPILRYLSSPLLLYCYSDGGGGERKRRRRRRRRMRKSCCHKEGLNRGAWTSQEDKLLSDYIMAHGLGRWRNLPANAGLNRCGKSCRLRWLNYLRPDIKRGNITKEEEELIIRLHKLLGNRWSLIAGRLPGRTDNEIKNYWNTHLRKRIPGGSSSSCSSDSSSEQTKDGSMKESADKEKKSQGSENVNVIRTKAVRCTRTMFVEQAFTDQLLGAADELGQYDVFADCRGVIRGADGLCPVEEAAAAAAAAIANQKSSRLLHEAEARSSIGLHDYCSTMANYADDYNYVSICNGEAGEDSGEFFRFISNDAWESLLMSPRV